MDQKVNHIEKTDLKFCYTFVSKLDPVRTIVAIGILLISMLYLPVSAQEKEIVVPYTLADRDRAIRTEARMETLEVKVDGLSKRLDNLGGDLDSRFSEVDKRFDRLEDKFDSYFMWGFGLVLMSIIGLIGFILYDRRSTIAPVESKTDLILKVLKEAGEKDPVLRDALKKTALW